MRFISYILLFCIVIPLFLSCSKKTSESSQCEKPVFNPSAGAYTSAQSVIITSATEGAEIRYTINGDEPTSSSLLYSTPIMVSSSLTIKAKAYKPNWDNSNTAVATYDIELLADSDAAETIAGSMARLTGGVLDQLTDLCEFIDGSDVSLKENKSNRKNHSRNVTITKTYNPGTGWWNINIDRELGDSYLVPYLHINCHYTLQFFNAQGFPQQYYITAADTARTVLFNVSSTSGSYTAQRISQNLNSLQAAWTVTHANLPIVTINGTYNKAAIDTLTSLDRIRTSNHILSLSLHDFTAPRGFHANLYQSVTGSITGIYDSDVTFISGTPYSETTLHRNVQIIMGDGVGNIVIGPNHFESDLYTGELITDLIKYHRNY